MTSILFLVEANERNQFRYYYPNKEKTFSEFFFSFLKSQLNFQHFQRKGDPSSRCISEIAGSQEGD